MTQLINKWWPGGEGCGGEGGGGSLNKAISMDIMQGVFYAACAGAILALIVLIFEKALDTKTNTGNKFQT